MTIKEKTIENNIRKTLAEAKEMKAENLNDYWNRTKTGKKYLIIDKGDFEKTNNYLWLNNLNPLEVFTCQTEREAIKEKEENIKNGIPEKDIEIINLS